MCSPRGPGSSVKGPPRGAWRHREEPSLPLPGLEVPTGGRDQQRRPRAETAAGTGVTHTSFSKVVSEVTLKVFQVQYPISLYHIQFCKLSASFSRTDLPPSRDSAQQTPRPQTSSSQGRSGVPSTWATATAAQRCTSACCHPERSPRMRACGEGMCLRLVKSKMSTKHYISFWIE